MTEDVKKRGKIIGAGDILNLVAASNCDKLREYFDTMFWDNKKPVLSWAHLKTALERNDRPMMRLLIVWGASPPKETTGITTDQWRLLHLCGLPKDYTPSPLLAPGDQSMDGIYVGQYSLKTSDGKSLGKLFNVFAAPEDLPKPMTYDYTVTYLAVLQDWNGFDGDAYYKDDQEIFAALKTGRYNGGWIIPPRDILSGKDVNGKETTPDNLYAHRDKFIVAGDMKRAFKTTARKNLFDWYWSSTRHLFCPQDKMYITIFSDGDLHDAPRELIRLRCRPVRLVPA